jgi:hypothetical protein
VIYVTDNEKRAHDLAVASMPILYDLHVKKAENYVEDTGDIKKEFNFNVFEEYLKVYETLLEEFSTQYPLD